MLRASEMVVIVGTSLVLTGGVMWTRSVAAGQPAQATARIAPQSDGAMQRAVRVVHPGHVRRSVDEAGAEPARWVDPYRIRKLVER